MTPSKSLLIVSIACILTSCATPDNVSKTTGQMWEEEIRATVSVPRTDVSGKDVKVEGTLFLSRNVTRVRGMIVVIHWGMSKAVFEAPEWRRFAESLECGLLHARIRSVDPARSAGFADRQRVVRDASVGGGEGLLVLLDRLATLSRHPELKDADILIWGHSAAGSFGISFAEMLPERTIGFIRYHSHRRGASTDMTVVAQIPALLIAGGKDATAGVEDSEELWMDGRSAGAPWTFVIEPDATHGSREVLKETNRLVMLWIKAVFNQRMAGNGAGLRPISENSAWTGDHLTGEITPAGSFPGKKTKAIWLPDEASARAWRDVSGTAK
ncbi:alpha/beta hydrolase family protein [Candidatus Hydrogenedentota bacterium]